MVTYKFADAREIDLAYATTIHKSQGSEYACTIIPISPSYNGAGFNSKNLLYTGITRAKKVFYFIIYLLLILLSNFMLMYITYIYTFIYQFLYI